MYSSLNEIFTIVECTWDIEEDMARELLLLLRDCSSYSLRNEQPKQELIEAMMQEIDARENMDIDEAQKISRLKTSDFNDLEGLKRKRNN